MSWTDLNAAFGYGSTLTGSQMQSLRDNVSAVTSAYSGAPRVTSAAIGEQIVSSASLTGGIIARLVQSGDAHFHTGSDGDRIPQAGIANDMLGPAQMSFATHVGCQDIAPLGTYTPTSGFYIFANSVYFVSANTHGFVAEYYIGGVWHTQGFETVLNEARYNLGLIACDGSTIRILNRSSVDTVRLLWRKLT